MTGAGKRSVSLDDGPLFNANSASVEESRRLQANFTVLMIAVALGLAVMMSVSSAVERNNGAFRAIFAFGSFLSAVGLAAAVWRRPGYLALVSVLLVVVGVAALAALTVLPAPFLEPNLQKKGWTAGPVSLEDGWAWLIMASVILVTGVALPFSRVDSRAISITSLSLVRIGLWGGAFWQVIYGVLKGDFAKMLQGGAPLFQLGVVLFLGVSWSLLSRGSRIWMGALTGVSRSLSFGRFLFPICLFPVVTSYLVGLFAQFHFLSYEILPLLNLEIDSAVLFVAGAFALRSLWAERQSRETLANALERSPVIIHSQDGFIEYWPKGCENLYGFTAAEVIGRRAIDVLSTEFPIPPDNVEECLRHSGVWVGEVRQTTRNGERLWIASRIVVDKPGVEPDLKLVETVTDITALKHSNALLRDTTESLTQAVAAYELGIVEYDAIARKILFSSEFERILGAAPGSLPTDENSWRSLMPVDGARSLAAQFAQDLRDRSTGRNLTIKVIRSDGAIRDLQGLLRYRFSPEDQSLQRVVGILMDVTDALRDRAEVETRGERLLELQAVLNHTSRLSAVGEMAAALAHELNQPLTAVGNSVGAIEMMLKGEDGPIDDKTRQRVLRAAKHAESQAVRAGEIVRRLREFITRGEADAQVEDLDLLIADAVALALPNPGAVGVEVVRQIEAAAASVLADRIQIQQVIVNLVRNAVEAMKDQDRARILTIHAAAANGMAVIRVSDSGAGVPDDRIDTLFSPFSSTKANGMGVGLSICRRIVEAHGGRMWYEPAVGGGAEFHFSLPTMKSEEGYVAT